MPIFFLSGALFPLDNLPKAIEFIVRIDPLSYGVDALRGALSNTSNLGIGLDLVVLLAFVIVITIIGAWQFSKIEI